MERSPIWPEAQTWNSVLPKEKHFTKEEIKYFCVANKGFAVAADLRVKYPERFKILVESFERTIERPEFADMIKRMKMETVFEYFSPEESKKVMRSYTEKLLEHREFMEKLSSKS